MKQGDKSKFAFITCVNDEDWYNECLLYLRHLNIPTGMSVEYLGIRGADSMTSGYNQGLR
ncbi:MAG: glycosyl transferase family 2, partial [Selenomonadaceae bacterium]|nr:glycosyl transferase family 2 [Selenomonadaceae bacterium]